MSFQLTIKLIKKKKIKNISGCQTQIKILYKIKILKFKFYKINKKNK
jgi:hypothetical protein